MARKIKMIWVVASEGSPVVKPNGDSIYHHHPVQIPDSTWARKKLRSGELFFCDPLSPSAETGKSPGWKVIVGGKVEVVSFGKELEQVTEEAEVHPEVLDNEAAADIVAMDTMQGMLIAGADLTNNGKPELPVLNKALEAAGLGRIDQKKRDELFARIIKED